MKIKFTPGFLEDCERLGLAKPGGWSLKKIYWRLVPYDWRPKQIFYRLKCFLWYRYTTIHPRTLPHHTWCDRSHLIHHCCFEILSQFMERELGVDTKDEHLGHMNWDSDELHKEALRTYREIYTWWKKVSTDPDWDDDEDHWDEITQQLHRLIDVRRGMWT